MAKSVPVQTTRPARKVAPAKKAAAPTRRYEELGAKNGSTPRTAGAAVKRTKMPASSWGDPVGMSPAQRMTSRITDGAKGSKVGPRATRALVLAQRGEAPIVEKMTRAAAQVAKVGKVAGRAAGVAGVAGAAYETGQTLTNPKKLKSAATGSRAATKAARGTATTASPMNMSGVGSVNAKSKKAMNAKSDAAKPVRKYAKSTPANDVTKRKGWMGGRGTM